MIGKTLITEIKVINTWLLIIQFNIFTEVEFDNFVWKIVSL